MLLHLIPNQSKIEDSTTSQMTTNELHQMVTTNVLTSVTDNNLDSDSEMKSQHLKKYDNILLFYASFLYVLE